MSMPDVPRHPGVEITVMAGDRVMVRGDSDWLHHELVAGDTKLGDWRVLLATATSLRVMIKPVLIADPPPGMLTAQAPDSPADLEWP
jgi:hypothetical protein